MQRYQSGFSLLELMVVVAIIGTISAMAVPKYMAYRASAAHSTALSSSQNIKRAYDVYWAQVPAPAQAATLDQLAEVDQSLYKYTLTGSTLKLESKSPLCSKLTRKDVIQLDLQSGSTVGSDPQYTGCD